MYFFYKKVVLITFTNNEKIIYPIEKITDQEKLLQKIYYQVVVLISMNSSAIINYLSQTIAHHIQFLCNLKSNT